MSQKSLSPEMIKKMVIRSDQYRNNWSVKYRWWIYFFGVFSLTLIVLIITVPVGILGAMAVGASLYYRRFILLNKIEKRLRGKGDF